MIAPVEVHGGERLADEVLEAVARAGRDDEIRGLRLQHPPHRLDIFRRPAPVTADRQVAEHEFLGAAPRDPARRRDDLARHEPNRPDRGLVVEEYAGARVQAVGLAVIGDQPECGRLRDRIGAARPERIVLARAGGPGFSVAFSRARAEEAHRLAEERIPFQDVQVGGDDAVQRLGRLIE